MPSTAPVTVAIPFRDLERAQDFYGARLGLRLLSGSVKEGHLEFGAGGGTTVQLFESGSDRKSENTAATIEVADLEQQMAELRSKHVTFEDYDMPGLRTIKGVATMGHHRAAWFKDPDGNVLCLHEGP
jgi:catechol 2,3-dioxygenase-like lactoylglutathione lyase family enzyme